MLDVRSASDLVGTRRIVLVGTLTGADLPLVAETFSRPPAESQPVTSIRLVLVKLWRAEDEPLRLVGHWVDRARSLGVDCAWCGPLPEVRRVIERSRRDEPLFDADAADLRAAAGWALRRPGAEQTLISRRGTAAG